MSALAHFWARTVGRRPTFWTFAAYVATALVTTWPLVRGLACDLPQDLADPLLNSWILAWVTDRLRLACSGDLASLASFWNANIFHPEPRTLALSEHLIAQSVQVLPLRWLGAGLVLCYNLLFLETFVLSALGMYLLARDTTGSRGAAFVAGLLFGFAPYRADQFAHLQVLTSQWMPFALLGLRRYVVTGRALPLLGATAALVAQALSCGYHLFFFTPFAALWAAHSMIEDGRWRDVRRWVGLALAAAAMAAVVVPLLLPYLEVRRAGTLYRGAPEVELFSADVYAYLTAPETLRLWGSFLRFYPGPESSLFPGLVPLALAIVGLGTVLGRVFGGARPLGHTPSPGSEAALPEPAQPRLTGGTDRVRSFLAFVAAAALLIALAALTFLLATKGIWPDIAATLHIRSASRLLAFAAAAAVALVASSARSRAVVRAFARSTEGFAALATVLAVWLSFGPRVRTMGEEVPGIGLYGWLWTHVPGFDGLRVPARFATVVVLFLAVLGAYGARVIARRFGPLALAALATLFLLESTAAPITLNDVWSEGTLARPPGRALLGAELPGIYHEAMRLPKESVLIELPFGSYPYELHYMLYSTEHHLRLVNGFSGALPLRYLRLREKLRAVLKEPEAAWQAMRTAEGTHAIVHEQAFKGRRGKRVTAWLEGHGAVPLARSGSDVLLALPR